MKPHTPLERRHSDLVALHMTPTDFLNTVGDKRCHRLLNNALSVSATVAEIYDIAVKFKSQKFLDKAADLLVYIRDLFNFCHENKISVWELRIADFTSPTVAQGLLSHTVLRHVLNGNPLDEIEFVTAILNLDSGIRCMLEDAGFTVEEALEVGIAKLEEEYPETVMKRRKRGA